MTNKINKKFHLGIANIYKSQVSFSSLLCLQWCENETNITTSQGFRQECLRGRGAKMGGVPGVLPQEKKIDI